MDAFETLLLRQYAQQEQIVGPRPRSREEQRVLAKDFALHMMEELHEYLDAVGYNRLMPVPDDLRMNRREELVDMLKLLFSLAWLDGFSAQELAEAFETKTRVVSVREHDLANSLRVAGFDIDGVIASGFDERDANVAQPIESYIQVVRQLRADGWKIVLVTTRKRQHFRWLEGDTYAWLDTHAVPYDAVLWSYDKSAILAANGVRPMFFVENTLKHALDVAYAGIPVFYVGNDPVEHPLITPISRPEMIFSALWRLESDVQH